MKKIWLWAWLWVCLLAAVGVLAQGDLPSAADLHDGMNYIPVPGATCARGTPYSFAARNADADKLMIYFQGGGACWNQDTCKVGGTFDDSTEADELDFYNGIFDFANPENPLMNYSIVVVMYCTADVHTGAAAVTFGDGADAVHIDFNGAANTNAVLAWVYENYPSPSKLIVAGTSAGAYGAIYHAASILQHYPDADAVVFGDAGIGVTEPNWSGTSVWNTSANLPDASTFGAVDDQHFTRDLYRNGATFFPNARFAEYTSYADQVQMGFYYLMGGSPFEWIPSMQNQLAELDQLPNFHSYIGWGITHTILPMPQFYSVQVNGVRFLDWFDALLAGDAIENIQCTDCAAEEYYQP